MIRLSVLVPFFYIVGLLGYWLVVRKRLPQKLFHKLMHRNTREGELQSLEDMLPDRVVHAEAYTAFNSTTTTSMSVFMSMLPEMPKQIWIEMSCFAHIHGLISRLLKEWNKWHM